MDKLLAVTAIGPDRTGIVRDVSACISDAGGNIRESRMTTLGSEFSMMLLIEGNWHEITKIQESLTALEGKNLTINMRTTEERPASVSSAPYTIDVIALDQEGIVAGMSGFFAERDLVIADASTRRYNAPHTGAPMFSIQMTVNVPRTLHLATLREDFHEYCETENLDAVIEPAQR